MRTLLLDLLVGRYLIHQSYQKIWRITKLSNALQGATGCSYGADYRKDAGGYRDGVHVEKQTADSQNI